jgi:hypothetical protein
MLRRVNQERRAVEWKQRLETLEAESRALNLRWEEIESEPWPVSAERSGTKPVLYRPWLSLAELDQELSEFRVTREKNPISFALLRTYRKYWKSFDASLSAKNSADAIKAGKIVRELDSLLDLLPRNPVRSVNEATALELAHVKARCLSIQQIQSIQENRGRPHKPYAIEALEMFLAVGQWHDVVMRYCDCGNPQHDKVESFSDRLLCVDRMRKCVKKIISELSNFPEMKLLFSKHRK